MECLLRRVGEEDPLSVMWRAYLDGKSKTQSGEKSSSGVGEHIYIGQYFDSVSSLSYLNARYYHSAHFLMLPYPFDKIIPRKRFAKPIQLASYLVRDL
jgi:hypothetical protein